MSQTLEQNVLPARTRIVREIRSLLLSGKYRKGESFLSERSLAEELAVGRGVVRGALAELKEEGLLLQGRGRSLTVSHRSESSGLLSGAIIVLTPSPKPQPGHVSQGWAEYIAQGTINELRVSGRPTVILDPTRLSPAQFDGLLQDRPAGVLFPEIPDSPKMPIDMLDAIAQAGIPLVAYGGSPELARFDRVRSDHEAGCRVLTNYLIGMGRRRILCFWVSDWQTNYWAVDRYKGYQSAMLAAGMKPLPVQEYRVFKIGLDESGGVEKALPADSSRDRELFIARSQLVAGMMLPIMNGPDAPDAILVLSDGYATDVAAALRLFGKEPGRDVLIGGYDNYWRENPAYAFESAPPAATVDKRNRAMGQEMVKLLLERVAGQLPPGPQDRIVQPELITLSGAN